MAQYGYGSYRISSTYIVSSGTGEPVSKPFAPFVPKFNNGNDDTSEGYVTKKKIVPVASRPCYSDNDESDDERKQPIRGSPRKVDEFLTKVRPSSGYGDYRSNKPIGGTGTLNNGTNYGDKDVTKPFRGNHDDGYYNSATNGYGGRKPIENTIRNNKYDVPNGYGQHKPMGSTMHDKYDGTNGYGDYGGNKEGRKPIGHDDYNNGYGDSDYANKEGLNPVEIPLVKKDNYDGHGGCGSPIKHDHHEGHEGYNGSNGYGNPFKKDDYNGSNGYGGYGDYNNNKEGHKPTSIPMYEGYGTGNGHNKEKGKLFGSTSPTRHVVEHHSGPKITSNWPAYNHHEGHEGYNGSNGYGNPFKKDDYNGSNGYGGYGDYNNNKEGHKPTSIPMYEGYGTGNGDNKEKGKLFGSTSPTRHVVEHHSGPKITSNWPALPRKGTALTKPMNDIKEAIELLKVEGEKLNGLKPPYENNSHWRRYDGPSNDKRAMDLANETERLKKIVPGRTTSIQPRFNPDGRKGRERDYVIDHVQLQRKYNGISI